MIYFHKKKTESDETTFELFRLKFPLSLPLSLSLWLSRFVLFTRNLGSFNLLRSNPPFELQAFRYVKLMGFLFPLVLGFIFAAYHWKLGKFSFHSCCCCCCVSSSSMQKGFSFQSGLLRERNPLLCLDSIDDICSALKKKEKKNQNFILRSQHCN